MNNRIALIICILFIIYILIKDYKKKPHVHLTVLLPLIWFMIIASRPVSQWFETSNSDISVEDIFEGSPFDRAIFIILILIGLTILFKRKNICLEIIKRNGPIFLFVLYCGISILWSDYPTTTFKRYIKGLGVVIMVLVVVSEDNPIEAVKTILRISAFVLIPFSILLIKYYRDIGVFFGPWGGEAIYAGVTTHKNALGRLCLITGFYFIWQLAVIWKNKHGSIDKSELLINVLFIIMIFWLLIKSDSATSYVTLIVGVGVYTLLGYKTTKDNVKNISKYFIFILLAIIILQYLFSLNELILVILGRDSTLTDRTILWKDIIGLVNQPMIGTGYDSFWIGERLRILWEKWWWKPNETHNGYLDVYIELGIIGVFLMFSIIIFSYKSILKTLLQEYEFGKAQMAYFMMFTVYNITEASLKLRNMFFLVFLMLILCGSRLMQKTITK